MTRDEWLFIGFHVAVLIGAVVWAMSLSGRGGWVT